MPTLRLKDHQDLENARVKYSSILALKSSEGEIQWSRYNAMLVVNTIIIGLIGFAYSKDFNFPVFLSVMFWFIPLLGIFLCYEWYQMTKRGFMWTKFWMEKANKIERQLFGSINPVIEGRDLRDVIGAGLTKMASLRIIKFFVVIYALIFISNMLSLNSHIVFFSFCLR